MYNLFQVSIITINFNNREGLQRTFASISKYQKPFIEYIVIDACSTDGSQDLIEKNKNLIDQVLIEEDKGIYDGMNKGISLANGLYTIFINSGDELESYEIFELLKKEPADVVYGNTKIQYDNGFERIAKCLEMSELWKSLPFVHQSVFVKTSVLKENLFNVTYKYCSDFELFCRLNSKGFVFKKTDFEISKIEAGGVSDLERDSATSEVFEISKEYNNLTVDQEAHFEREISRSRKVRRLKKILPKSIIKLALKIKYRK